MSVFASGDFRDHATRIVLCLTIVPLWQTGSWLPTLHSVAPREQPSSSAGRSGPPAHKQKGDTQQICNWAKGTMWPIWIIFSPKVVHMMIYLHLLSDSCVNSRQFWSDPHDKKKRCRNTQNTVNTEVNTDATHVSVCVSLLNWSCQNYDQGILRRFGFLSPDFIHQHYRPCF